MGFDECVTTTEHTMVMGRDERITLSIRNETPYVELFFWTLEWTRGGGTGLEVLYRESGSGGSPEHCFDLAMESLKPKLSAHQRMKLVSRCGEI